VRGKYTADLPLVLLVRVEVAELEVGSSPSMIAVTPEKILATPHKAKKYS
jgi:hypothetical protein